MANSSPNYVDENMFKSFLVYSSGETITLHLQYDIKKEETRRRNLMFNRGKGRVFDSSTNN